MYFQLFPNSAYPQHSGVRYMTNDLLFLLSDRHSHDTVDVQKEEEKKFKEVGEAYAVLSDQKKRTRYDNGHDLEDLDGGGFGLYFTLLLTKIG